MPVAGADVGGGHLVLREGSARTGWLQSRSLDEVVAGKSPPSELLPDHEEGGCLPGVLCLTARSDLGSLVGCLRLAWLRSPAAATEGPATEGPATESPATESPATESPATESPATESPATERAD